MFKTLKMMFRPQVRILQFELEEKFLTMKMEENFCLDNHLAVMYDIYSHLVYDLDYLMDEGLAINGVLRSLPPSYKDAVIEFVKRGESLSFYQFLAEFRPLRTEPIGGEVIDGEGIFDIRFINVFLTLIVVNKYMILILFYENRTHCLRSA